MAVIITPIQNDGPNNASDFELHSAMLGYVGYFNAVDSLPTSFCSLWRDNQWQ